MTTNHEIEFQTGQDVCVMQPDGSSRAATYVGNGAAASWFGGAATAIVVYSDTASSASVEVGQLIARHELAHVDGPARSHRRRPR